MNDTFFALAFIAAANPKLLALDLLLIDNRRPRAMFASILATGICTGVTVGLIIIFALPTSSIHSQRKASAGLDLALGLILLLIGGLLMTGILARVWARRPGSGRSAKTVEKKKHNGGTEWAQRALRESHLWVACLVGFIVGLPGAAYLTALHNLLHSKSSTGTEVAAVIIFVIIEFLLIIIPWLLLEIWPARTARVLRGMLAWVTGHGIALIAWICLLLGVYLTISGIVRLVTA